MGTYRPALSREAMSSLAPEADATLLDAAEDLLSPLWPWLEHEGTVELPPPAVTFDPVHAAGPTNRLAFTMPDPPPSTLAEVPADDDLPWLPASELAELTRAGLVSPTEVVHRFARRIEAVDPELNAFITVTAPEALSQAGKRPYGRLAGVPIGLKDLVDTAGVRTTCGSRIHDSRVPDTDAWCWQRLRSEGALLMGKLNTHEFAAGVTSENDHFGAVRNPWDHTRIAGGSSGGSAAAVSAGLTAAAIGTDTGGSIRIPAGCCGVVGLKPTFGLVPTTGVQALSWSLDHVGPLTRTVRDAGLMLDVLADTACEPAARAGAEFGLAGLRVAVPVGWLDGVHDDVRDSFSAAVAELETLGARVVAVPRLPSLDQAAAVNRVIAYAEGSAVHDRLLFGQSVGYGPNIRPRQEAGRFLLAAHYLTAQRLRAELCRWMSGIWEQAHVLVTPVLPCRVPETGAKTTRILGRDEPIGTALVRFTGPFNLTGLPAITVMSGRDSGGLPTGLQIAAPPHADALTCFVAAAFERSVRGHEAGGRR